MTIAPSQILYLENGSSRLYAEAIQIVESRRLCWARPTLLIQGLPTEGDLADRQAAIATAAAHPESSELSFYGLEDCPDIIWPVALFNLAFDIDFFSLISWLESHPETAACRRGQRPLQQFVGSFWPAQAGTFKPCNTTDCAYI